jgi:hypothetical protein
MLLPHCVPSVTSPITLVLVSTGYGNCILYTSHYIGLYRPETCLRYLIGGVARFTQVMNFYKVVTTVLAFFLMS